MLHLKSINNIIFDLGGVIINIDQQKVFNEFLLHGIQSTDIEKDASIFKQFEKGELSVEEFVEGIQLIIPSLSKDNIISIWNSMLLDIPNERIELLKTLSQKFNIYLLSNTNSLHLEAIENYVSERHQLSSLSTLFKKAYYSHELGMRKPEKEIFLHVLKESKLDPQSTLFIDDSEEHILSAKKLGLQTHWLNLSTGASINKLFDEN